ncbi:NADH-cytochrome b5 reductase 1-like [Rutidosis leptorrhynchoides]|uniref:NADH-cytochrome b5 reductase 1-like n=1 Tax=Rutidosis leptorrhynchoides TaxID=125765 RepID=UPI003A99911A
MDVRVFLYDGLIIAICQCGGNFETHDDGFVNFIGRESSVVNLYESIQLTGFKQEVTAISTEEKQINEDNKGKAVMQPSMPSSQQISPNGTFHTRVSNNVAKFRFALPTPTSVLGLPIGQHISCRGKDSQGEEVIKPYMPTTLDTDVGYFELVIKMYPQGRMSHHFREMKEGDYLSVKGPKGRFKYRPGDVRAFGMIAGGSGITPMFQVARAILDDESDKTTLDLIYAIVTVEDILLKEELDRLATKHSGRFKVYQALRLRTVMSAKAIGIAIKLTLEGSRQALDMFNIAVVSPIYYAIFTSFTILAGAIMFKVGPAKVLARLFLLFAGS